MNTRKFAILAITSALMTASVAVSSIMVFQIFADGFSGPENLAFDGKDALYMTDTNDLWKIAPDGNKTSLYKRDETKDGKSLCGVCIGPDGKVFFSASNRILAYNSADGKVTEYATGFKLANGITIDDLGELLVADMGAKTLYIVPVGAKTPTVLSRDVGMINGVKWTREDKTIYYTTSFPAKLNYIKFDSSFKIIGQNEIASFGTAFADDFTMDTDGNFYVALWKGGKVVKVTRGGKKEDLLEKLDGPSAVAFGEGAFAGKLFVCVKGSSFKFDGTTLVMVPSDAKGYPPPFVNR